MQHCMVHPPKPDLELVFFRSLVVSPLICLYVLIINLKPQKNVVEYCYRQSNQHSEYNPAKKNKYKV